jgi:hypothetical protein
MKGGDDLEEVVVSSLINGNRNESPFLATGVIGV